LVLPSFPLLCFWLNLFFGWLSSQGYPAEFYQGQHELGFFWGEVLLNTTVVDLGL
jgi:hypothetical protein